MEFATALFAPFALLLSAAGFMDAGPDSASHPEPAAAGDVQPEAGSRPVGYALPAMPEWKVAEPGQGWALRLAAESHRPGDAYQVRIEQRMTIRIVPRPPIVRPDAIMDMQEGEVAPRFIERRIGKCLPVSAISSVQTGIGNQLILFMRDRRIIRAQLERACRARDFYSGFYVSHTDDGQLCVDRDTLLSRNGATCKLTRISQLIEVGE